MKRCAFTLAETLITLAIIGVVAALTVPTLSSKFFERMAVTRAKQTYSQIYNAFRLVQAENRCKGKQCFSMRADTNADTRLQFEPVEKKLKIKEVVCPKTTAEAQKIDWLPKTAKGIEGQNCNSLVCIAQTPGYYQSTCYYLLENGVILSVSSETCWWDNEYRKYLVFDVNGKKPPNQTGKDQFPMGINTKITSESVLHSWISESGGHVGVCGDRCFGGRTNIPERHPLTYIIQNDKLPDLSKLKTD